MMQGCVLAAFTAAGILVTWAIAIAIGMLMLPTTGPATLIAALIAAGIITAFAVPQLMRGLRECPRRQRR
jgi:hypothetical protein